MHLESTYFVEKYQQTSILHEGCDEGKWQNDFRVVLSTITDPHLTRALTANLTTVESKKRGVTRMWNSARAAKASEGLGPVL